MEGAVTLPVELIGDGGGGGGGGLGLGGLKTGVNSLRFRSEADCEPGMKKT